MAHYLVIKIYFNLFLIPNRIHNQLERSLTSTTDGECGTSEQSQLHRHSLNDYHICILVERMCKYPKH